MVRSKSGFPRNSAGLWPALGHTGRRIHPAPLVFDPSSRWRRHSLKTQSPTVRYAVGRSADATAACSQARAVPRLSDGAGSTDDAGKNGPARKDGRKELEHQATPAAQVASAKPAKNVVAKTRSVTQRYTKNRSERRVASGRQHCDTARAPAMQSDSNAAGVTTGAIGADPVVDCRQVGPTSVGSFRRRRARAPPCCPHNGPVMTHTRIYIGNDSEFTEASPATITSATMPASAAGKTTCSAAMTSSASAVTCTSAECSRARRRW